MATTKKQIDFALGILEGKTNRAAYEDAGYSTDGMSDRAVAVEASRLKRNEGVRRIIGQGIAKAAESAAWNRAEAMRRLERCNARLLDLIERADAPDARLVTGFIDTVRELDALANVAREVEDDAAERWGTRPRDEQDEIEKGFYGAW